jgi:hypothetical protein
MTRSHMLLHCNNARLVSARQEAWGAVHPRSVRILLANPRWERHLFHSLDLLGVGRMMDNGEEEEETWATRMGGWIIWETAAREPD